MCAGCMKSSFDQVTISALALKMKSQSVASNIWYNNGCIKGKTGSISSWAIEEKSGNVVLLEADFSPNSMALFFALAEISAILVPLTESISHKKKEFAEFVFKIIIIYWIWNS